MFSDGLFFEVVIAL
jgi:hypothetical protein